MTTPLHRPNPGDAERGPLLGGLELRSVCSKSEVCEESTGSVYGKRCRRYATSSYFTILQMCPPTWLPPEFSVPF